VAVRVTDVPLVKLAAQVPTSPVEQLIPPELLVTVPVPLPRTATVRRKVVGGGEVNVAVTDLALSMLRIQVGSVPEPAHSPPQLTKVAAPVGVAVRVTLVPVAKVASQVPGQLIAAGLLVTVPLPTTERDNVSANANRPVHVPH
jgi:hypothetical protein